MTRIHITACTQSLCYFPCTMIKKELPPVRHNAQVVTLNDGITTKKGVNRMIEFLMTIAGLVHSGLAIGHGFVTIVVGNPILGFVEILIGLHTCEMYTRHLLRKE